MALTYTLTLAGEMTTDAVIARAFPVPEERPMFRPSNQARVAALQESHGFALYVMSAEDGYVEAEANGESWVWEPGPCVDVTFRFAGGGDHGAAMRNMMALVERLLGTGPEPAAFVFNDDTLILRRDAEGLHRFSGGFWDGLAAAKRSAATSSPAADRSAT